MSLHCIPSLQVCTFLIVLFHTSFSSCIMETIQLQRIPVSVSHPIMLLLSPVHLSHHCTLLSDLTFKFHLLMNVAGVSNPQRQSVEIEEAIHISWKSSYHEPYLTCLCIVELVIYMSQYYASFIGYIHNCTTMHHL